MVDFNDKTFLVLEGIDLSGKTTQAKLISRLLTCKMLASPSVPFSKIKRNVLENVTPLARFCFFLTSNIQVSEIASTFLRSEHVICDRYIWSTIACNSAIENVPPAEMIDLVQPLIKSLLMPHIVVYLKVSRKFQLRRAKKCARYLRDDSRQRKLLASNIFQQRLMEAYEKTKNLIKVPWVEIDTSNMSVLQTAQEIIEATNLQLGRGLSIRS